MTRGNQQPAFKSSVLVTFEELSDWCGRKHPTKVAKWLTEKGILFMYNADNKPVTTAKALNESLMKGRKTTPNFGALIQ